MTYSFLSSLTNRAKICLEVLDIVEERDLEGNLIELGVGDASTNIALAQWLRDSELHGRLYSCDTFSGVPYNDDRKLGAKLPVRKGEQCDLTVDEYIAKMKELGLEEFVVPIEGLIERTLPQRLRKERFCFAWIDIDLYQATSFAYEFLETRVVKKGIIGFHDYGFHRCPGVKMVVDEEVNRHKFKELFRKDSAVFFERR